MKVRFWDEREPLSTAGIGAFRKFPLRRAGVGDNCLRRPLVRSKHRLDSLVADAGCHPIKPGKAPVSRGSNGLLEGFVSNHKKAWCVTQSAANQSPPGFPVLREFTGKCCESSISCACQTAQGWLISVASEANSMRAKQGNYSRSAGKGRGLIRELSSAEAAAIACGLSTHGEGWTIGLQGAHD